MFIRRTKVKSNKSGENYFTFRLVETYRSCGKVKQRTLLNLGRHFGIDQEKWHLLTSRIEQILNLQTDFITIELPVLLEKVAHNIVKKLHSTGYGSPVNLKTIQSVDIGSLEVNRPRKIGIEQLALYALEQLELSEKLKSLGLNRYELSASIGNIIGRMARPASELATRQWLQQQSGLGELIGYDYDNMGHDRLYHASDLLWKHKDSIETHLYNKEQSIFALKETVTLYDLTNTFFEGSAVGSKKAEYGRSKEKRSDCPIITLALVLDSSGFPRRSRHFSGNASEPKTLQEMLLDLDISNESTVVMDAGIASKENIDWLVKNNYRYLVVCRKNKRHFDPNKATIVKNKPNNIVKAQRVYNKETGEIELYCHSEAREQKEQAMQDRAKKHFEDLLCNLDKGLRKKGTTKKINSIHQKIGRLKQKYSRVAQHYIITVDEENGKATAVTWKVQDKPNSQATHPGVYCLRTNQTDWDEVTLWETYTMLTNLEAVFRSLKSELGLRPIYHQKDARIDGHLFITLLAYHLVHFLRTKLKDKGIHDSWESIRQLVENRQRVTVSVKRENGKTIHIRKTTRLEPHQVPVFDALGLLSKTDLAKIMLI